MSIASAIIIRLLRLSNMRSKLANGAQKTYEEAVSYNEKHPFVMPKDKKAIYEKIIIKSVCE